MIRWEAKVTVNTVIPLTYSGLVGAYNEAGYTLFFSIDDNMVGIISIGVSKEYPLSIGLRCRCCGTPTASLRPYVVDDLELRSAST